MDLFENDSNNLSAYFSLEGITSEDILEKMKGFDFVNKYRNLMDIESTFALPDMSGKGAAIPIMRGWFSDPSFKVIGYRFDSEDYSVEIKRRVICTDVYKHKQNYETGCSVSYRGNSADEFVRILELTKGLIFESLRS